MRATAQRSDRSDSSTGFAALLNTTGVASSRSPVPDRTAAAQRPNDSDAAQQRQTRSGDATDRAPAEAQPANDRRAGKAERGHGKDKERAAKGTGEDSAATEGGDKAEVADDAETPQAASPPDIIDTALGVAVPVPAQQTSGVDVAAADGDAAVPAVPAAAVSSNVPQTPAAPAALLAVSGTEAPAVQAAVATDNGAAAAVAAEQDPAQTVMAGALVAQAGLSKSTKATAAGEAATVSAPGTEASTKTAEAASDAGADPAVDAGSTSGEHHATRAAGPAAKDAPQPQTHADAKIEIKAETARGHAPAPVPDVQTQAPAHSQTASFDALLTTATTAHAQTASSVQAASTAAMTATLVSSTAPVPLEALAVNIAARASSGRTQFDVQLDPAELGRIDVRISVDRHGQVTSHLAVERPDTLDMLRRDASSLQRALDDAGLKTGDGGLQFSLRQQTSQDGQQDQSGRGGARVLVADEEAVRVETAGRTYGRAMAANGGLDIRV